MLEVSKLNAGYGHVQIIRDISFNVNNGEVIAILGSNGAGKTTTVRALTGMLRPLSGSVKLNGEELCGKSSRKILDAGIIQVPEGRQLFTGMTVLENLELGAFSEEAMKNFEDSLKFCYRCFPKLEERSDQIAGTLSGGEQQMAAVARALIGLPKLLILDEPSLGLAPNVVDEILTVAHDMARKQNISVILVEQDVNKALNTADRGYVIENGHVVLSGPSSELRNNEHVKRAYLGI